jgi:hypothetical protein
MGFYRGPNIVRDGLVLALDAGAVRSYPGSGTTAYNLVGSNNFTLQNGLTFNSDYGGYFKSDGSNDGLYTPDASNLDLLDFSLEGWVWWDQHKDYGSLLVKGPGGTGNLFNYSFFFYATQIRFGFGDGTNYRATAINISNVPINQWHHILGTYDGTDLKFYVNGNLINTTSPAVTPNQNSDNLNIIQAVYPIDGRVATTRIYNRALSSTEIAQNYNAQKSRFGL